MHPIRTLALLGTVALAMSPAIAQDAAPAIELGVDNGSVLVSTGGEFAPAAPGQALAPGHRVLVPEGGAATLSYGNGCRKALAAAGVYTITPDCDLASAERSGPGTGVIVGVAAGVAAIAAAGGGGGSDNDNGNTPPPVSR